MTATIADGRAIARKIRDDLATRVAELSHTPRLDSIVVGDNKVTASFVNAKKRFAEKIGVEFVEHELDESITTEEIVEKITFLAEKTDGIVVQLPLPKHVDIHAVTSAIPASKDVDLLNDATFELFQENNTPFVPPVAGAVLAILNEYDVTVRGKKVAVIGKGRLVGGPSAVLLTREGGDVTVLDRGSSDVEFAMTLDHADIVVAGAGVPGLVQPNMVHDGVVLIDAGTSNAGRTIEGDVAKSCAEKASLVSQTPGGVGPITVAILFQNLIGKK